MRLERNLDFAVNEIRERILSALDMRYDIPEEKIVKEIRKEVLEFSKDHKLSVDDRLYIERSVFNSLRKLDILQDLLDDDDITEIMINGENDIFVEKKGKLSRLNKRFSSRSKLDDIIQQIVAMNNQMVNESSPIVDTRLPDGSRVNIVLPPVSVDRPTVTIRRFPKDPFTMSKLIENNSMSVEIAEFLETLIKARYNVFISGGTGSGKTTLLNALTQYIPPGERVISIEDSAELQIRGVENLVRLEARQATLEGKLEVTIRDLVKSCLRMRPDRIIVGEVRGAEALEMLQAANTGHDGTLSTGHANSSEDMVARLETMTLMGMDLPLEAIRMQIASGIDFFVHISRMRDRSRKLVSIDEVEGIENGRVKLRNIYALDQRNGEIKWRKSNEILHREKLERMG